MAKYRILYVRGNRQTNKENKMKTYLKKAKEDLKKANTGTQKADARKRIVHWSRQVKRNTLKFPKSQYPKG